MQCIFEQKQFVLTRLNLTPQSGDSIVQQFNKYLSKQKIILITYSPTSVRFQGIILHSCSVFDCSCILHLGLMIIDSNEI